MATTVFHQKRSKISFKILNEDRSYLTDSTLHYDQQNIGYHHNINNSRLLYFPKLEVNVQLELVYSSKRGRALYISLSLCSSFFSGCQTWIWGFQLLHHSRTKLRQASCGLKSSTSSVVPQETNTQNQRRYIVEYYILDVRLKKKYFDKDLFLRGISYIKCRG